MKIKARTSKMESQPIIQHQIYEDRWTGQNIPFRCLQCLEIVQVLVRLSFHHVCLHHLNPYQTPMVCNDTMIIASKILTLVSDKNHPDAIKTGAQIGTLVENGLTIPEIIQYKMSQEKDKEARMKRWHNPDNSIPITSSDT